MGTPPISTSSEARLQEKPQGDSMIDRAVAALGFAFCWVIVQVLMRVNAPDFANLSMLIGASALLGLWLRGVWALITAWTDPSARILRFVSVGALLLTSWPVGLVLLFDYLP